jgi:hypothetical protein
VSLKNKRVIARCIWPGTSSSLRQGFDAAGDEARDYFRTELIPSPGTLSHQMGEGQLANKLARRAEAVFANHPFWQRKYKSVNGRGYILSSMRHWLAGVLAKENPVLFRQLPESFKIGLPLPATPNPVAAVCARRPRRQLRLWRSPAIALTNTERIC